MIQSIRKGGTRNRHSRHDTRTAKLFHCGPVLHAFGLLVRIGFDAANVTGPCSFQIRHEHSQLIFEFRRYADTYQTSAATAFGSFGFVVMLTAFGTGRMSHDVAASTCCFHHGLIPELVTNNGIGAFSRTLLQIGR